MCQQKILVSHCNLDIVYQHNRLNVVVVVVCLNRFGLAGLEAQKLDGFHWVPPKRFGCQSGPSFWATEQMPCCVFGFPAVRAFVIV